MAELWVLCLARGERRDPRGSASWCCFELAFPEAVCVLCEASFPSISTAAQYSISKELKSLIIFYSPF